MGRPNDDPRRIRECRAARLVLISEHPGVVEVGTPQTDKASGTITVDVTFAVNLPNEWRRQGESPSGVRLREVVRFEFSGGFPMNPPQLSLRADFSRNLPHMQPWLSDGRPVPCIYDGDLTELLHREGLAGILNQTALWLERAALGTLMDPDQGWEPVRRDFFEDVLVVDAGHLQGLVDRRGGYRFMKIEYLKFPGTDGPPVVHGQIASGNVPINRETVGSIFGEAEIGGDWRGAAGAAGQVAGSGCVAGETPLGKTNRQRKLSSRDGGKCRRPQGAGGAVRLQERARWRTELARAMRVGLARPGFVHDGSDPPGPPTV